MNYTTLCFTSSPSTVTRSPNYLVGGSSFTLVTDYDWLTVDSENGELSINRDDLPMGVYTAEITYVIGPTTYIYFYYIEVIDCSESLQSNTFTFCQNSGTWTQQLLFSNSSYTDVTLSTPPTGVSVSTSGLLTINTNTLASGAHVITVNYDSGKTLTITINNASCVTPTPSSIVECEKESIGIVWVNAEGGRQSYWFNQVKEYKVNQSGSKTYINTSREQRYSNRGRVVDAVYVNQEYIPIEHLNYLGSLKGSIQAWYCTDINNLATYQSIILDQDSYTVRRTNDRFFSVQFQFEFSKAKLIQRQ